MKLSWQKQRRSSALVVGCLLALAPAFFDRPVYQLYAPVETEANDGFLANGEPSQNELPGFVVRQPPARFWRNYSPETGVRPGYVRTVPFELKNRTLTIPVYGFPNSMFAGLYVESLKTQTIFRIDKGAPHNQWDIYSLSLPQSLVHSEVRIIAYSHNAAAVVGFGTPYYRVNNALPGVNFSRLFVSVAISLGYLFLLFFPVVWVVRNVRKRFDIETVLAAAILTSLLCFLLFFCAYSFPAIGRTVARAWLLGSLGLSFWEATRGREWRGHGSSPVLLVLGLLMVFYGFFLFSFNTASPSYSANYVFYPAAWSTDNQIPVETADLLAKGSIQSEWPFGHWKLSDRPPLLASLLYPLAVILNDFPTGLGRTFTSVTLQIAGFGLQGFWILPAWMFFGRLGFGRKECLTGCLIVAASPFVFFNSVYIWPKLLSAGFCLAQFVYLPGPPNNSSIEGKNRSLLSGISAALAMMAHSGIALAVVAVALVGFLRVPLRKPGSIFLLVVTMLWVLSPWVVWTKTAVPTSNPLPKYFFTGDFGMSRPDETVLDATRRFYRSISAKDWLRSKGLAAQTLLGFERRPAREALGLFRNPFVGFSSVRAYQMFFLLPCIGVLCLTILPLCVAALRRSHATAGRRRWIRDLGIACLLGFVFHFLLMMSPHLLHHYPYFVLLALHLLAATSILAFHASTVMKCIALFNYGVFALLWVLLPTVSLPKTSIAGTVFALTVFGLGSVLLTNSLLRGGKPSANEPV